MNRQETDKEAKATKNVKDVWKWILGVGIVLVLIAFFGGFFNHDQHFTESDNPSEGTQSVTDSAASGANVEADTMMESVRGTK